jgi:G:T-mismatch repair DNA endonuclease (very short patch repair protein)
MMNVNAKKHEDWTISSQASERSDEGSETSMSNLARLAIPIHVQEENTPSAGQLVECKICHKLMKMITNTHLKNAHQMTCKEYKNMFPDEILGETTWFTSWRNSEENKSQAREHLKRAFQDPEIQERRIRLIRENAKSEKYRQRLSESLKRWAQTEEGKEHYSKVNLRVTSYMKLSNFERWVQNYGVEEALRRQKEWQAKNVLPSKSRDTKIELVVADMLSTLNISFIKQFSVPHYYCDFFLPDYNLIIEVNGDYWHASPKKFSATDVISHKKIIAQQIWDHDAKKVADLKTMGYQVLVLWESDIKQKTAQQLAEDIVHATEKDC